MDCNLSFLPTVSTIALFFSLFPAVAVIFLRHAVLRQRQRAIFELDFALSLSAKPGDDRIGSAIPAFEYVKMKYNIRDPKSDAMLQRLATDNPHNETYKKLVSHWDFSLVEWIVGCVPLFIFLYFTGQFIIVIICRIVLDRYFFNHDPVSMFAHVMMTEANFATDGIWPATKWIDGISSSIQFALCAAFFGAYLNMFVTMFRSVNNFDLGPATFIEAAGTIFLGMTVGMIAFYFFDLLSGPDSYVASLLDANNHTAVAIANAQAAFAILVPFIAAFFPGPVRRWIFRSRLLGQISNIKREATDFNAFTATSLEVIDGIDSTIRERLEDFHIYSIQNLAAANPLMLYVETPYGVYEIVDWVAQAQLFSAFGSVKIVKLWTLGIRTIFDLERFILDPACRDVELLKMISRILIGIPKNDGDSWCEETLKSVILSVLEASHVHRLRQVFLTLSEAVGARARRFPPIPTICATHAGAARLLCDRVKKAPRPL